MLLNVKMIRSLCFIMEPLFRVSTILTFAITLLQTWSPAKITHPTCFILLLGLQLTVVQCTMFLIKTCEMAIKLSTDNAEIRYKLGQFHSQHQRQRRQVRLTADDDDQPPLRWRILKVVQVLLINTIFYQSLVPAVRYIVNQCKIISRYYLSEHSSKKSIIIQQNINIFQFMNCLFTPENVLHHQEQDCQSSVNIH